MISNRLNLTEEALRTIVARSSTIAERRNDLLTSHTREGNTDLVAEWKQVSAADDDDAFSRILEWQGLLPEDLVRLLSEQSLTPQAALPDWAETLQQTVNTLQRVQSDETLFGPGGEPLPFQEIWHSIAITAEEGMLKLLCGNTFATDNVLAAMRYDLITLLSTVSMRVFYTYFAGFRSTFYRGKTPSPFSAAAQDAFLDEIFSETLITILSETPVLARLHGTIIQQWQQTASEFLNRLDDDADKITELIGAPITPESLSITTGISDRHRNGRRCIKVMANPEKGVIYKPRSLDPEICFSDCLAQFLSPELHLPVTPACLNKGHYGWEEYIVDQTCTDEEEVKHYFRTGGALIFFTYLLSGTDFHSENLIAHGSSPVLIDLEGIAAHLPGECSLFEILGSSAVGQQHFDDSVMRSALVSLQMVTEDGELTDVGGFPLAYPGPHQEQRNRWKNPQTDAIAPERRLVQVSQPRNEVSLKGTTINPQNYLSEIIDGFTHQYRCMLFAEQKQRLKEWLNTLPDFESRFIYRDTAIYSRMTELLFSPKRLRDGASVSVLFSGLARTLALSSKTLSEEWKLVESEQKQLLQLDAPIFYTKLNSRSLFDGEGNEIANFFRLSAFDEILGRIQNLSDEDLRQQQLLIDMAYRSFQQATAQQSEENTPLSASFEQMNKEELALQIANRVAGAAIVSDEGVSNWMGVFVDHTREQRMLQPMLARLYDGFCGPALFLALASTTLDRSDLERHAEQTLLLLKERSANTFYQRVLTRDGIGGYTGLCSIIYTLWLISRTHPRLDYSDLCLHYSELLSMEMLKAADQKDVLDGVAGAALVLSGMLEFTNAPHLRKLVLATRDTLLAIQPENVHHTGFAHGSAGILAACARVGRVLHDPDLIEHAKRFLTVENKHWSQSAQNWASSNSGEVDYTFQRWCHGAPGIVLSRLELLKSTSSEEASCDLKRVAQQMKEMEQQSLWNLCCGSAGAADIAGLLAEALEDDELRDKQEALIMHSIEASLVVSEDATGSCFDPGLFHGVSGVGYSLLRLLNPTIPCILLLE